MSQNEFARALGTSGSRFSTYVTGRTVPSAALLLRASRTAVALARARQQRNPTALAFATAIREALRRGDEHWVLTLSLEARDGLRDTLDRFPDPESDQEPPRWAAERRLEKTWAIGAGDRDADDVTANTPPWLAKHGDRCLRTRPVNGLRM